MMAQVLRKIPLINKMMINWAEKQAPEDQSLTEDVLDALTRVEEPREVFVESEDRKATYNLELLQADHVAERTTSDEAKWSIRRAFSQRRAEP